MDRLLLSERIDLDHIQSYFFNYGLEENVAVKSPAPIDKIRPLIIHFQFLQMNQLMNGLNSKVMVSEKESSLVASKPL
jgi:hypothetical protein